MNIEVVKTTDELKRLKEEWEALHAQLGDAASPFSSHAWHVTWWKHYSAGECLHLLLLRDEGRLVGIAPLVVRKANMHGLPVKAVCFMENNQTFFNDFIVLPEYRDSYFSQLLESLRSASSALGWDLIYWNKLSTRSDNYASLIKHLRTGSLAWREEETVDAQHIAPEGDWSDFFAARSTKTRKTLRNIRNSIHRAGEVSVRHLRSRESFEEAWDDICRVAEGSWTGEQGESMASPAHVDFYRELAEIAADKGWLSVWTLSLDGNVIAIEFHLRQNLTAYAMCGHYLPEYRKLSPGTYLEMAILQEVFEENRLRRYELGDHYSYKEKWSGNAEPQAAVTIFNGSLYGRLVAFHEREAVPFLRQVLPQGFWQNKLFRALGIKTAPFTTRQD